MYQYCSTAAHLSQRRNLHWTFLQCRFKKGAVTVGHLQLPSVLVNLQHTITYHKHFLRSHLIECLEKQAITPFTFKKISRFRNSEQFNVYCYCCQPENDDGMIKCDGCHEWYHEACIAIPKEVWTNKKMNWF